jgi:hypothetical protein
MIGYILTDQQYKDVQGKFINPYEVINCNPNIDGTWYFLANENDRERFGEYAWLFDLPQGEYIPKPTPNPFDETN